MPRNYAQSKGGVLSRSCGWCGKVVYGVDGQVFAGLPRIVGLHHGACQAEYLGRIRALQDRLEDPTLPEPVFPAPADRISG